LDNKAFDIIDARSNREDYKNNTDYRNTLDLNCVNYTFRNICVLSLLRTVYSTHFLYQPNTWEVARLKVVTLVII